MTRSRIRTMTFFVFLSIFLLTRSAVCDGSPRANRNVPESTSAGDKGALAEEIPKDGQKNEQQNAALPASTTTIPELSKTLNNITSKSPIDADNTKLHTKPAGKEHAISLNAGALKRGFYVFLGLSVLVMAYIVFRSFRLSKTRAQMVRKYGVLAHRQDVEMRPLPLDEEDDEDTTVFDASNVLANNVQQQNL